jgi:hypothetical protein
MGSDVVTRLISRAEKIANAVKTWPPNDPRIVQAESECDGIAQSMGAAIYRGEDPNGEYRAKLVDLLKKIAQDPGELEHLIESGRLKAEQKAAGQNATLEARAKNIEKQLDDNLKSYENKTQERISQLLASKKEEKAQEPSPEEKAKTKANREKLLAELNDRYAVIMNVGGQCVVADQAANLDEKAPIVLISFENFNKRHANQFISGGETDKPKQVGPWWLTHRKRRQYEGLILKPGKPGIVRVGNLEYLNLWRGFGVEPKKGDWSLMREHIRTVLANGDPGFDNYIIKWTGWAVQHPDERAEVALIFKGKKGSGKTLFGQTVMDFFGMHGKPQSDPKRLTGQFNAYLRDTILLFLDEMRWSSKRDDEGILQTLITGKTIFIEDKNISQYEWPNRLHVIVCSNAGRVIPATEGERRYAVGETNNRYAKDECPDSDREAYFTSLYRELDNGGREAMLYDLLHMELGDFHPRLGYKTAALQDEKKYGVAGFDAFYQSILEDGFLPGETSPAPNRALTMELYKEAQARVPDLKFVALNQVGTYFGGAENVKLGFKPWKTNHGNGWEFPRLGELRRDWERRQGGWQWPNDLNEWTFDPKRIEKEERKAMREARKMDEDG